MKKLALLLTIAMLLAACQPAPEPEIIEVTVPVEVTRIVTQPPKMVEVTVLVTQPPLPTYTPYPTYTPHPPYPTYTPYPTFTPPPEPTATPKPTATPRPIATSTPTPRPKPKIGSRSSPVPFGQAIEFLEDGKTIKMTLARAAWGEEADTIRNAGETFMTYHAPEGKVMLVVYFEIEYLDGPQDETWGTSWLDFSAEINKVLYNLPITVWDEELRGLAYPGGALTGWFELTAPIGVGMESVKLIYKPSFEDIEVWFAVE